MLEISNVLVNLQMFQYPLVKTITISRKVFSSFSHPIKYTNCADFLNLNYELSILLVFYPEKSASFEKYTKLTLMLLLSTVETT